MWDSARSSSGAALVLILLLWPPVARAQDQRAVLDLIVNGVPRGEAFVTLRNGDVLIAVERLAAAGLRNVAGEQLIVDAEPLVSLASLAPGLTFAVDERDLRLIITASPAMLGENVRTFGSAAPRDMVYRSDTSAFVNYSLTANDAGESALFTESAAHLRGALVYNTLAMDNGSATRGLSSVMFDDRARMRRWTIGDGFAQTGVLGGDAWLAGVTVAREFGIEPYFVRHAALSLSTPIAVPSTVEVHVNGRIVSQEQVEPGRLDMRNLPLTVGANDASIVVRDAFGAVREISTSYYLASSVLAKGIHDYQYSVGFLRQALGNSSWDYRAPVALARHRVGITETITAGGRFEASRGLWNVGPGINVRLRRGEVEAGAAISGGLEGTGGAVMTAYTYVGSPFSAGFSFLKATTAYATINGGPHGERSNHERSLFGSLALGPRMSVTAQDSATTLRNGTRRGRSSLLVTTNLTPHVQLGTNIARVHDEAGTGTEVFAGVTVLIGKASAGVAANRDRTGNSAIVEAQESMPVGTGYGYHLRAQAGSTDTFAGAVRYQNRFGRYELRRDVIGGRGVTTGTAAGGIVAIGGGLYPSRPVEQSFALVRVPGVEGVRGFASNQEVGRTDRRGNLLIPDLQPYYGNVLNISDADIPLEYSIGGVRMTLAVPYRSGALAVFPVERIRRTVGAVVIGSGPDARVPEYGEMRLTIEGLEAPVSSPLGRRGDFYFENLPVGRHAATVLDRYGACDMVIDVPASDEALVDLGALRCMVETR